MADTDLHGRVAVITGANQGIGAAAAVHLASLGADIVAAYLRISPDATSGLPASYVASRAQDGADVVAAVMELGRRCIAVEADLSGVESAQEIFDAAQELGSASILVNNASGGVLDTFDTGLGDVFGRQVGTVTADSS